MDAIENEISILNDENYVLVYEINKLQNSVINDFAFDINKVDKIFRECNIHFSNQLKKNYEDLLDFNKKISTERNKLIKEVLEAKENELFQVKEKLKDFNYQREHLLNFIQDTDTFRKFKEYQKELIDLQGQLQLVKEKIKQIDKILEKEKVIVALEKEKEIITDKIKYLFNNTENNSRYTDIKKNFILFTKI